jgi:predicted transcriptional regulator
MITELQAGYTATLTVLDILTGLLKTSENVKINAAIIEIQRGILEAQKSVLAANEKINELSDANAELKKQLAQLNDWSKVSSRYELKEVVAGILLYALLKEHASVEPFHYLCPHCFKNQKKSILQKPTNTSLELTCHDCGFKVRTESAKFPPDINVIRGFRGI